MSDPEGFHRLNQKISTVQAASQKAPQGHPMSKIGKTITTAVDDTLDDSSRDAIVDTMKDGISTLADVIYPLLGIVDQVAEIHVALKSVVVAFKVVYKLVSDRRENIRKSPHS